MTEREKLDTPEKVNKWLLTRHPSWNAKTMSDYYNHLGPESWWKLREKEYAEVRKVAAPKWVVAHNPPGIGDFWIFPAEEDQMKISFIPSVEYGRADRRVVTTVGKFLMKYYETKWTESQIRDIADEHRSEYGPPVVYFLFDADSIQQGYEEGVRSCMSHKELRASHEHPVRVYDGPDTALAVLRSGNKVTARTVVNIAASPMKYTRIYGDPVLKDRLVRLGFSEGTLSGTRLRKVMLRAGKLIVPYVDSCAYGRFGSDKDFIVLGGSSSHQFGVQYQHGVADVPTEPDYACDHCAALMVKEAGHEAATTEKGLHLICSNCASNPYMSGIAFGRRMRVLNSQVIVADEQYHFNNADSLAQSGLVLCRHDNTYRQTEEVKFVPSRNSHYVTRSVCKPAGQTEYFMKSDCNFDEATQTWRLREQVKA